MTARCDDLTGPVVDEGAIMNIVPPAADDPVTQGLVAAVRRVRVIARCGKQAAATTGQLQKPGGDVAADIASVQAFAVAAGHGRGFASGKRFAAMAGRSRTCAAMTPEQE